VIEGVTTPEEVVVSEEDDEEKDEGVSHPGILRVTYGKKKVGRTVYNILDKLVRRYLC
jgi:hypothetical protein